MKKYVVLIDDELTSHKRAYDFPSKSQALSFMKIYRELFGGDCELHELNNDSNENLISLVITILIMLIIACVYIGIKAMC